MGEKYVPILLKWGAQTFSGLHLHPGLCVDSFKQEISALTGVPVNRQKLMCKGGWKGVLQDGVIIDSALMLPPGQVALTVVLVGTVDAALLTAPAEETKFIEDLSPEAVAAVEVAESAAALAGAEGMIIALQKLPRERDDRKMETYKYSGCSTGLPQRQIEDLLRRRREKGSGSSSLLGEVAMTFGLELGRAYVNVVAVLHDGTVVSGLDNGKVQLWRHGTQVREVFQEMPPQLATVGAPSEDLAGITCISAITPSSNHTVAFATGGNACVKLWTAEADCVRTILTPIFTTPVALVAVNLPGESYIATAIRRMRPPDPHAFRLVPQNGDERMRRAHAEAVAAAAQERLSTLSRSVMLYAGTGSPDASLAELTLLADEPACSVTALATLSGHDDTEACIAYGDARGGLRLWRSSCGPDVDGRPGQREWTCNDVLQLWPCQLSDDGTESVTGQLAAIVCMVALAHCSKQLVALSTEAMWQSGDTLHPRATKLRVPCARAVFVVDIGGQTVLTVLSGHQDTVICMCTLPDGGLATGGGKLDATVQIWEPLKVHGIFRDGHDNDDEGVGESGPGIAARLPVVLSNSRKLKEPGYVFALTVVPDSKHGSELFALAAARYNVVKICL